MYTFWHVSLAMDMSTKVAVHTQTSKGQVHVDGSGVNAFQLQSLLGKGLRKKGVLALANYFMPIKIHVVGIWGLLIASHF